MGATLGGAFAGTLGQVFGLSVSAPAFAMVGMGAMVGGSTGAAMTAVTMIFEMTRSYDIVLPMILAVGASLATRRLLSSENIFTAKLVRRGQAVPRGLHANLFLVQKAKDVMETDVQIVSADTYLDEFLRRPEHNGAIRHVVLTREGRISGVLRIIRVFAVNSHKPISDVTLGAVAQRKLHDRSRRLPRCSTSSLACRAGGAAMALVVSRGGGRAPPGPNQIRGIITKEHIADSVAKSVEIYSG